MIREKFNLRCTAGHKHFAPNPDHWVGQPCAKPFGNPLRVDGLPRLRIDKCDKPMRKMK